MDGDLQFEFCHYFLLRMDFRSKQCSAYSFQLSVQSVRYEFENMGAYLKWEFR